MCEDLAGILQERGESAAMRTVGNPTAATLPPGTVLPKLRRRRRGVNPLVWVMSAVAAVIVLFLVLNMGGDSTAAGSPVPPPQGSSGTVLTLPPNRTPPAPRRTVTVKAPQGAQIVLGSDTVATSTWSSDTLAPGQYTVSASVASRVTCPFAVDSKKITLADTGQVEVELNPRECGWINVVPKYNGKFDSPELSLTTLGWNRRFTIRGSTPLRVKVPVGQHRVQITARYCYPYTDTRGIRPQNDSTNPLHVFATLECGLR